MPVLSVETNYSSLLFFFPSYLKKGRDLMKQFRNLWPRCLGILIPSQTRTHWMTRPHKPSQLSLLQHYRISPLIEATHNSTDRSWSVLSVSATAIQFKLKHQDTRQKDDEVTSFPFPVSCSRRKERRGEASK